MFIPIKDENPTRNKPVVTFALIIINCLVYLYSMTKSAQGFQIFTFQYGLIPYEIVHLSELTPQISSPILLTPFTSMFMHGGFMHLAGNMLYLWIFGNNIEDHLGHVRFLLFYLLTGIIAAVTHTVIFSGSLVPMVGASGAISGVLGAYAITYPKARVVVMIWLLIIIKFVRIPAFIVLGLWFLFQINGGFGSFTGEDQGIAWFAHIGG